MHAPICDIAFDSIPRLLARRVRQVWRTDSTVLDMIWRVSWYEVVKITSLDDRGSFAFVVRGCARFRRISRCGLRFYSDRIAGTIVIRLRILYPFTGAFVAKSVERSVAIRFCESNVIFEFHTYDVCRRRFKLCSVFLFLSRTVPVKL